MHTLKLRRAPSRALAGCALTAALALLSACGKTADDDSAAAAGRAGDSALPGSSGADGLGGSSGASTNGGANSSAGAHAGTGPSIPEACIQYGDVVRGYLTELSASGGSSNDDLVDAGITEDAGLGPCTRCIAACSREIVAGCEAHSDCVVRHCTCEGCENRLPEGDFCACVESCNGPQDQVCSDAWLDYTNCLAQSCAGSCPSN